LEPRRLPVRCMADEQDAAHATLITGGKRTWLDG